MTNVSPSLAGHKREQHVGFLEAFYSQRPPDAPRAYVIECRVGLRFAFTPEFLGNPYGDSRGHTPPVDRHAQLFAGDHLRGGETPFASACGSRVASQGILFKD